MAAALAVLGVPHPASGQAQTSTGFIYPIGTSSWNHGSGAWLERDAANGGGYFDGYYHLGEDMLIANGNGVYAIAAGTVTYRSTSGWGTGNIALAIRHKLTDGSEFLALYGHIRSSKVVGNTVAAGEVFATIGPYTYGDHLHFGIHPGLTMPASGWGMLANSQWPSTNGFVDPVDWIRTRSPYGYGTPAAIELYNVPASRWYRNDEPIPWRVTQGTDPVYVREIVNSAVVAGPYNSRSGFIHVAAGGNGWKTCWAQAQNAFGYTDSQRWDGGYDVEPPTAHISDGAVPKEAWYTGPPSTTWKCTDGYSGVKQHWMRWDEGSWNGPTAGDTGTILLPEGIHILDLWVEDQAWDSSTHVGNAQMVRLGTFKTDLTPPTVGFASVIPPSPTNQRTIQLAVTASDPTPSGVNAVSGVKSIDVYAGSGLIGSLSASGTIDWTPGSEGKHIGRLVATDNAGNSSETPWSYVVDWTAPTVADPVMTPTSPSNASSVTIHVSASDPGSGVARIEALVNGQPLSSAVTGESGDITWDTSGLADGVYTITIRATDAAGNVATGTDTHYEILHITTALSVSGATAALGQKINLAAKLTDAATKAVLAGKTLQFLADGQSVGSADTNASGVAVVPYTVPLAGAIGDRAITVTFVGDNVATPATGTAVLKVTRAQAKAYVAAPTPTAAGAYIRIYAYLWRVADGAMLAGKQVVFQFNGLAAGQATTNAQGYAEVWYLVPSTTAPGARPVAVSYAGDSDLAPASATGAATVNAGTPTSLYVSSPSGGIGGTVTLYAYLRRTTDNAMLAAMTVDFLVDGTKVGSARTDGNGYAAIAYRIPVDMAAGSHRVSASFIGDGTYRAAARDATMTVTTAWATVLSMPSFTGSRGLPVTLYAYLYRANDKLMLDGKTVSFKIDGSTVGTAVTDANGKATLAYTVPAATSVGVHTVISDYAGDTQYTPASRSGTISVAAKGDVSLYAPVLTAYRGTTATLYTYVKNKGNGALLGGKTVRFELDGVTVGTAVSNSAGYASCAYAIAASAPTGLRTLKIVFDGDATFNPGSGVGSLTVR